MKSNIICFKLSKPIVVISLVILVQLVFLIIGLVRLKEEESFEKIAQTVQEQKIEEKKAPVIEEPIVEKQKEEPVLEEYVNMPRDIKGYQVVGRLEIPSIKLDTYILSETNTKSLKVSITKLYGPEINTVGNFCMAGHNYRNMKMFGGIKKLVEGDTIILTDTFDRSVRYKVYSMYQSDPKDVSCLSQETGGEREITLITCTTGAIKRVIVKAIEDYD